MKKHFKRRKYTILLFSLFGLSVLTAILAFNIDNVTNHTLYFMLGILALSLHYIIIPIYTLVIIINELFFFSDFKITVVQKYDYLIFELSKYDHRIINKNKLEITKKTTKLILSDGTSIMKIPYNSELLNFLIKVSK